MPIYRIADLNILIEPLYDSTLERLKPYITDRTDYDFKIKVTQNYLNDFCKNNSCDYSPQTVENSFILTRLCERILKCYNGFFFHSSSLMLDGEAYVFSAPSGTGKSTHTALWRKRFGERVAMINDDKPIIRKKGDIFYIYGTPWMGKADIGNNISAPIKAVYILQRGTENIARRVEPGKVFKQLLEATVMPADKENMSTLLGLLDEFFSTTPLFLLTCNTDDDAVETAYSAANNLAKRN